MKTKHTLMLKANDVLNNFPCKNPLHMSACAEQMLNELHMLQLTVDCRPR